ncbi:MAG: hypothetical protein AAFZ65_15755, partial [Planctomycetota bacterium]
QRAPVSTLPYLWRLERETDVGFEPHEPALRPTDPEWIGPLEPGRYRLTLSGQGARHALAPDAPLPLTPVPVVITLAAGEARRLELPAPPDRRLVLDLEQGAEPVAEARLESAADARSLSFVPAGGRARRGRLEASGTYLAFEALPVEASELLLVRPSGRTTRLPLPAGEADVRRTVPR